METTTKLLEKLAEKLGTTVEYLWSVLLYQARISAIADLFMLVLLTFIGYGLYRARNLFIPKEDWEDEQQRFLATVFCVVLVVWGISFIRFFFSIGNIINGLFHPDYWALKKIMDYL